MHLSSCSSPSSSLLLRIRAGGQQAFYLKRAFTQVPVHQASQALGEWTQNQAIRKWVGEYVKLMKPERVHLVDGSDAERKFMIDAMVRSGTLIPLNDKLRPNSYYARSDPGDVARVEKQTLICTKNKDDVGPTNNWADPDATREEMKSLYNGCMQGRTMYVVPYSMGPVGSPLAYNGIEITDSPYVVQSMRVMARMGDKAHESIGANGKFVPGVHSVGAPLKTPSQPDSPWPCNPTKRIVHYPESREILSFGSGYGGNALLGKKCFALRIAGAIAKDEGWLAEHMLILGVTPPKGKKFYVAAAFPSACGKTNFAMMKSALPDMKIECVGDDIAWMRWVNGKLHAINPENGFFGVAPGTGATTNPNAMESCKKDTIFTNVALTADNDVWWEGMSKLPAGTRLTDWLRRDWVQGETTTPAAHPNSRFCAPASNCPIMDPKWESREGVPIDAIIFGGRRSTTIPLIYQSRNWQHGTFLGATMGSEQTAAAEGTVGAFRPDPMAMIPFGTYNIGDYFKHWLDVGKKGANPPAIFYVNFFKKKSDGKFVWPGFGENARLLKWIAQRIQGGGHAVETPIGYIPDMAKDGLDLSGLNLSDEDKKLLFKIDKKEWTHEVNTCKTTLNNFGNRVPKEIHQELAQLETKVKAMA